MVVHESFHPQHVMCVLQTTDAHLQMLLHVQVALYWYHLVPFQVSNSTTLVHLLGRERERERVTHIGTGRQVKQLVSGRDSEQEKARVH